MDKILITGGAGFIGSNLAKTLISKGYFVRVLDNLSEQIHGKDYNNSYLYNSIKDSVDFIIGDIRNREDWLKSINGIDVVIHLAAETGTGQSMYEIQKYIDSNINSTGIMLDILTNNKHNVKKIIVASSRAIYGEGKYRCREHGIVYPLERKENNMTDGDFEVKCPICCQNVDLLETDENSKIHPTSVYGYTKKVQEELSMLVGRAMDIPTIAMRFQNVYGPGQSLTNPYTGILSIFSTRIRNNNDIVIFEDGKESRDFVYIDDVVNSIMLVIENGSIEFECFNVGSGQKIDVLTIAETLKNKYKSNIDIKVTGNFRVGDIRHNCADLNKIKTKLNYVPKVDFVQGISNFVDWVETQEIQKDEYEKSIIEMKKKGLYK